MPYDFCAKNLTPYGGLLPVATMLEKIGFEKLIDETVTVERTTKAMSTYQFFLAIILGGSMSALHGSINCAISPGIHCWPGY